MHDIDPPDDKQLTKPVRADMPTAFAHTVEARYAELTPTAKRIASYMLANLERLGLETADQIAQQTATSGISVGRFLRSIGYRNLDDLKRELRGAQERPWMITDRLDEYRRVSGQFGDVAHNGESGTLTRSLQFEIDAIQHVYRLAQSPMFARIAERISNADAVYIGMSGSYVDSLNSEFASPYLIVTDTRAYSMIARRYCDTATRRGVPFALVTDIYCPWAREFVCDLLQVKTDVGQFWDSLAPLTCLFNLLITAIVARLGSAIDKRVARNRELQGEFNQFDL
jgi:DNA-binding MurR/RpiR family transcriptional regulator